MSRPSAHGSSFALVGGGPTGVELAGAIAELAKATLAHDFRRIDPESARIVLVEAGPGAARSGPVGLPSPRHDGDRRPFRRSGGLRRRAA